MDDIFSKVDRTAFSVVSLHDAGNDTAFWLSRTPAERFAAIEYYRQQMYNFDPAVERIQRVLETAEFKTS